MSSAGEKSEVRQRIRKPQPKSRRVAMTRDKAGMMRLLREEGATFAALSAAFGCSQYLVQRTLAGEAWGTRQCVGCWRLLEPAWHQAGRCRECFKQICCECGGPKRESRKSERCRDCDGRRVREWLSQPGRRCGDCGEEIPAGRRSRQCVECDREERRVAKRARRNAGKVCSEAGCEKRVPEVSWWEWSRCKECKEEHDRRRRALSRRYCGICGKELKHEKRTSLCGICEKDDRRIRARGTGQSEAEIARMMAGAERRERRSAAVDGDGGAVPDVAGPVGDPAVPGAPAVGGPADGGLRPGVAGGGGGGGAGAAGRRDSQKDHEGGGLGGDGLVREPGERRAARIPREPVPRGQPGEDAGSGAAGGGSSADLGMGADQG